ncbi:hypothetical protein AVEN_35742-1 [Araneus ventricosus]|uniref:Uncharacterized protein n=1 Tax=Araneus ventricosus TaxID=182803 RepID=A0A4Y2FLC9_ARAVE|nr:hypothetical protein AVEN_35742-1 [Araneus ventricosus]
MLGTICGRQPYSMRTKKTLIPISKDFRSQTKKLNFFELLEYVKSRGQEIAEVDAFEVLHCNDEALTVCQLTDAEICSMVLVNPKTLVFDSEENEEKTQTEDKMLIDSLVELLNTTIKGLTLCPKSL